MSQELGIQEWLAIPIEMFKPEPAMIYPILLDSKLPYMAQFIPSTKTHWEAIPGRAPILPTHVLHPKQLWKP